MGKEKKRIPTIDSFQGFLSRIPKLLIFSFAAACIVFIIVHAGFFDDRMVCEDYRHFFMGSAQRIRLGRFFCFYLITSYCNAWTIGCEVCFYYVLSTLLVVDLFKVRTRIGAGLAAALVIGMPSLSYQFVYLFSAPLVGRGLLLSVLAVWLADRRRLGFIPAAILFALALGVVQSTLIDAAVLCVLVLLRDAMLEEQFNYKTWLVKTLKFVVMGIVGVALYFVIWRSILRITGLSAANYKGMSEIGSFTLPQIISAVKQCYVDFINFFFGTRFFYVSKLQKIAYGAFFAASCWAVVYTCVKHPVRIPGLLVALLLLPLCIGCIQIFVPETATDTLMVYPIVFLLVLSIKAVEDILPYNGLGRVVSWLLLASLCVTCLSNYDITSASYVKAETYHENTAAYENRLLMRIEETPGYYEGIPVAILANGSNDYHGLEGSDFPHVINDRGLWYSFTGTKSNNLQKTIGLITVYTGVKLNQATQDQVKTVQESSEFAEMTAYPLEGSIKIIDGVLTVNCIYREIAVMQADENTVLLDYISHVPLAGDETYAWNVFKDGKRVPELERGYNKVAGHMITLTEDGSYSFKCFFKQNGAVKSFTSTAVVVKDGVIASSGLKQISLEEALDQALPPVQVGVELLGERAVSLTMLDNSLHPGPEYTYAWRVYREGEHLAEFDRAFSSEPNYDLTLDENGVYRFELICRKGDEGKEVSAMSEEITVMQELELYKANGNTVFLDYVGPDTEQEGVEFAWYVFRDNERIVALGREYSTTPGFTVTLEQDGTYKFQCFCRAGGEKRSVMSYPVVVENGLIADDPRLGQISLEEAADRSKLPAEVQVTLVGDRGVKLTMIDNYLNAGPEYTYAWYVYRNGERLEEYDRKYQDDPEYDLILQDDGVYQFKLYYRIGDNKNTVMSEAITIGNAQSGENAA